MSQSTDFCISQSRFAKDTASIKLDIKQFTPFAPRRRRLVSAFKNMYGSQLRIYKSVEKQREHSITLIREIASTISGPSLKSVHPQPCSLVTFFLGFEPWEGEMPSP